MPPLTYAQIRREKDLYGNQFADMDPAQYAAFMNNLLGNNDYDAGQGNWFAQGAKALSYGVDEALRATHLPQALGDLGQNLFGDVGRHTFESAPRMAIDMLPFMRAGKLGMALGGGAMALNTFEKTNSTGAAAVAAATAPLFGPLAKWGGEAAVGLGSRMGMNVARTQAGAAGVGGIGLLAGDAATSMVGRGLATSLATGGVLKSGLARGVEVAGQQTGMMGANLASQALVGAAAAPTGQRWDTVKQMFTTDLGATLGAAALTQVPFAAWSGAKAAYGAPAAEVKFVKDYAQTLARYDKQVYGPEREAIAQGNLKLAANLETAKLRASVGEQKLGLPAPGTRTADAFARDFVGERFVRQPDAVTETAIAAKMVKPMEKKLRAAVKAKNALKVDLYTRKLAKLRERAGFATEDILNNPAPNRQAASGQLSDNTKSQSPWTKWKSEKDRLDQEYEATLPGSTERAAARQRRREFEDTVKEPVNPDDPLSSVVYFPNADSGLGQRLPKESRGVKFSGHEEVGPTGERRLAIVDAKGEHIGWVEENRLLPEQRLLLENASETSRRLQSDSPEVRLKAAMEVNGETPETIQVQVDALQAKGESPAKAAETVATVQTERAKRAEALRAKREQEAADRMAAREASNNAAQIRDNEALTTITKPLDDVTNVINKALLTASKYGQAHTNLQNDVRNAALNWHTQYGRDVTKLPELQKMLGGVLKVTSKKPVNDKSRANVSDDTPGAPVATKGVPGIKYPSREAADTARNAIKNAPDGNKFQWTVSKIKPDATKDVPNPEPHWVIVRRDWASDTVQSGGKEVVDQTLTPDEWTARLDDVVSQWEEDGVMQDDGSDMTPQLDVDPVIRQTMEKFGESHEGAEDSVVDSANQVVGDEHGAKTTVENILSPESLAANLSETEARLVGRKILTKSDPDNAAEEVSRGRARLVAAMDVVTKMRDGATEVSAVSPYVNSESALWRTYKAWEIWKTDKTLGDSSPYNILRRWTRQLNQVTANKGNQFLSSETETTNPVYMGEVEALGELARNVGLDESYVPELARLVSLWDNADVAFAQLKGDSNALGLFTQQRDGQKLVWLSANGDRLTQKMFVLAHELNGHGLFQAMREGRLDAETSSRLQAYMDHISENSPEVNSMLLRELWTTLPKRYRKDDGLQKLVNSRLTDSEEVLSNFNAIISLGLASKGRPGWISEALTWLPKPIGDAMVAFASWGRKMFEAINGLMFMRKGNWTRGIVDPAELGQMHDYVKTMHSVLRANRTREAQLEQSIRMQMVNEPKYMLSALADGSMWADGVTSAGDTLVKEFRLLEPPPEKRSVKETIGAMLAKPNRGLNHFLMPLVNYAQRHGWLRHTVVGAAEKAAKNASIENEILKEMGLVRKGMAYRADDSHPMSKVAASPMMRKILNDITWRANVMETTVEQLVASGDKVVREALSKLPTEQQTIVRESVARGEVANTRLNEMIHREQYERLVFVTGESLMLKDSTMSWETAEARARQIVGEVQSGQITSVDDVVPFVQKVAGRIEKQVDWFKNRPYFVSARRFGEHSIRVNKRDGTHEVLDFRTADERQAWMVQNREAIVKGDLTPYLLKAEQKNYSITQTALDMIKDLEAGQKDEIVNELVRVGIAADAAEGIADRFSQASYLQRELQARNVPSMSPHRKFVAGYESLDVIRQQIEYLQMVTHTLTKGISNARFEMQMRDPRTRDLPEAKSIRQAWQQNQAPDMRGTQLMQRAGYTWYMAGHLLNMLQDAVTPLSGALYGNLVDDGGGVMATGKRLMTAMADAKSPKRQTAFERQMLERYKKGNRGLASFTDEGANDYLATFNAHEKLKGYNVSTMGQLLTRPVAAGFLHMRNFHKHFTDFGLEAGLLATFRHFKAKGLADAVAEKEAFALQTIAMGGGKYNRPAGLWASGRLQPLSAAMSLLQGFAYNQMFTFKNFFEKSIGSVPNLSKEQRVNATKAFATHSGLMFAQAGIFGIPMAAALMAIIDKVFDTNSKENIANFINENVDVVDGDVERQIAMHGLINAFGGVDYASKAQIPGVLGFNAQNGFSFESLAGPMGGMGNVALESLQSLAQGDVGGAITNAMPNNFRRLLQSWKNDWEFRRKDGSMVAETTPTDKALYALMGLRPRSVADIVERDQWQAIDANIERNANESWKEDMVELFREDPAAARAEILKRANERQESPAAIANSVVDQIMEKQMPRDAGRRPGASEKVNRAAGVTATPISEVQRLQSQQAFLQQLGLGLPATPTSFERAMQIDGIRAQNPWLSYDEAVRRVDGQSGALQSRMMRGASFGMR